MVVKAGCGTKEVRMSKKIIAHGREQAVRAIIRLLPRISFDNLVRLTNLAQWLTESIQRNRDDSLR